MLGLVFVSSSFEEKTVVPVLVSPRKGQIVVDDKELKNYKVELEHLSASKSKRLIFFNIKTKLETEEELDIEKTQKLLKLRVFKDLKALRRNNV